MQISFTGGFLANGGILQISRLKVNSKRDLYYSFAPPMKNRDFFPQNPPAATPTKTLAPADSWENITEEQKTSEEEDNLAEKDFKSV